MEKKQTEFKQSELSASRENNSASSDLIEHVHQVEDSPFTIIYSNHAYHICIANQIVGNQPFKDITAAEEYIAQKPWQLILTSAYIYHKLVQQKVEEAEKEKAGK